MAQLSDSYKAEEEQRNADMQLLRGQLEVLLCAGYFVRHRESRPFHAVWLLGASLCSYRMPNAIWKLQQSQRCARACQVFYCAS